MKINKKNLSFAAAIIALIFAAVCFLKITPAMEFYGEENPLWQEGDYVTFSVECKEAAENTELFPKELRDEKYIPSSGYIISPQKIALKDGDSVYSILERTLKYYKIPFDAQGTGENSLGTVYVTGINQLFEFSGGEQSGWVYTVNGKYPNVACDKIQPKNGDKIVFSYTVKLGEVF